jgi:hypothetical protein
MKSILVLLFLVCAVPGSDRASVADGTWRLCSISRRHRPCRMVRRDVVLDEGGG